MLFDEDAALDALKAFLVSVCPEVPSRDIYVRRPGASPAVQGPSVLLSPLTALPVYQSFNGSESTSKQVQVVRFTIVTPAPGPWSGRLLGVTSANYVAGGGDTAADVATGLRGVMAAMGAAASFGAVVGSSFTITANVAGASMLPAVTQAGTADAGVSTVAVIDDNLRRAVYNFGTWTVRLGFREVPSAQGQMVAASGGTRGLAVRLCERVRLTLQATSIPVVNGAAYPYRRDVLASAPGYLSRRSTGDPQVDDQVENGTWSRIVSIDVTFDVRVGLLHDVPSLDTVGVATLEVSPV